jgi:hypothetical protein
VLRVCLLVHVTGAVSVVARYASALANALHHAAAEFPELSLRLLITARRARAFRARHIAVELARGAFANANAGGRRILSQQVQAFGADIDLLHFFEIRRDLSDRELDGMCRGTSILVLPSEYEDFGFTALEATARGCLVPASDIPALREVSGNWALPAPGRRRGCACDAARAFGSKARQPPRAPWHGDG